uniref:S1 motif domain-containing protein n=1 Tax=Hanusia phi TaxID=3032 RepID=A0A7S0DVW8_9CRYP
MLYHVRYFDKCKTDDEIVEISKLYAIQTTRSRVEAEEQIRTDNRTSKDVEMPREKSSVLQTIAENHETAHHHGAETSPRSVQADTRTSSDPEADASTCGGDEANGGIAHEVDLLINELKSKRESKGIASRYQELEQIQMFLLQQKQKLENAVRIEFQVDASCVGLVVGKRGSNIAKASAVDGVMKIDVQETNVVILAETEEAAETARQMLEHRKESISVERRTLGLLVGKGGKNLKNLQSSSGVLRIEIDDGRGTIELLGNSCSIEKARRGIELIARFVSQQEEFIEGSRDLYRDVKLMVGNSSRVGGNDEIESSYREDEREAGNQFVFSDEGMSYTIEVPSSKLGLLIGHHGTKIKQIQESSKCGIDIVRGDNELSKVFISAISEDADPDLAFSLINNVVLDPQPGQAYHQAPVTKVAIFGVFVALGEGREGLLHVSDVPLMKDGPVNYDVGETLDVVVTNVDDRGRIRLGLQNYLSGGRVGESIGKAGQRRKEEADTLQQEEWPLLGPMQESRDEWYARIRSQREDASHPQTSPHVRTRQAANTKERNLPEDPARSGQRSDLPSSSTAVQAVKQLEATGVRSNGHAPSGPRHLGRSAHLESTGPTRHRMEQPRSARVGDADYSREYVLYAPKEAGKGGGGGVSRPSDRDGIEAGGQEYASLRQRVAQARGRR